MKLKASTEKSAIKKDNSIKNIRPNQSVPEVTSLQHIYSATCINAPWRWK